MRIVTIPKACSTYFRRPDHLDRLEDLGRLGTARPRTSTRFDQM